MAGKCAKWPKYVYKTFNTAVTDEKQKYVKWLEDYSSAQKDKIRWWFLKIAEIDQNDQIDHGNQNSKIAENDQKGSVG